MPPSRKAPLAPAFSAEEPPPTPRKRTTRPKPSTAVERLPEPRLEVLPVEVLDAPLTPDEARELTNEIKTRTVQLWMLVERAHSGRAFEALGYATWKEYAGEELKMSESRSFQLLDQAKVMRQLSAAGADAAELDPPPVRVVQAIRNNLPEVQRIARETLAAGGDIQQAIRDFAATLGHESRPVGRPKGFSPKKAAMVQGKTPLPTGERPCIACGGSGHISAAQEKALKRALNI